MAAVVRYVNRASTPGGDGTTNATTGATRAYASLNEWEAAEQNNLVTNTDTHTVHVCGTSIDSTQTNILGWGIPNATYFITVMGNRSHANGFNSSGIFNTGNYYALDSLIVTEEYTVVDGVQAVNATNNQNCIHLTKINTTTRNCITNDTYDAADVGGIYATAAADNCYIYNNIVIGLPTGGAGNRNPGIYGHAGADGHLIYNNTIYNAARGMIDWDDPSGFIVNNVVFSSGIDWLRVEDATIDYNSSDTTIGTNWIDISPSTPPATYWDLAFADYSANNFAPKKTGVLYQSGLDNGSDSNVPLTDYYGNTRNLAAPCVGAIEYQEPVPGIYRKSPIFMVG